MLFFRKKWEKDYTKTLFRLLVYFLIKKGVGKPAGKIRPVKLKLRPARYILAENYLKKTTKIKVSVVKSCR